MTTETKTTIREDILDILNTRGVINGASEVVKLKGRKLSSIKRMLSKLIAAKEIKVEFVAGKKVYTKIDTDWESVIDENEVAFQEERDALFAEDYRLQEEGPLDEEEMLEEEPEEPIFEAKEVEIKKKSILRRIADWFK